MRLFGWLGSALTSVIAVVLSVIGVAVVVTIFTLEVSGISYRKDCATPSGTVKRNWTFQWFAPVPFIFRPSEEGCNVHVGTRVLLSYFGVDRIKPETAGGIAMQTAAQNGDNPAVVYYSQVYAASAAWLSAIKASPNDLIAVLAATRNLSGKLDAVNVPAQFLALHQRLETAVKGLEQDLSRVANGEKSAGLSSSIQRHQAAAALAFTALQRQAAAAATAKK